MKLLFLPICMLFFQPLIAWGSVYQWSVLVPPAASTATQATTTQSITRAATRPVQPRAFLWIPENCRQIHAVIFGQHNMLEEDIFDDPRFRSAMGELGFAIVWVTPAMDNRWEQARSKPRFDAMMQLLADVSGYGELSVTPVVPIGHSACASFPWNFAAANPQRTFAILSIHGDAPRTPLAGFGPQHVTWPDGAIDGIPGLMAMGQYEWSDARLQPAIDFCHANPRAPIAVLAEPGAGHFAAADTLVPFLTMLLQKAAASRLPQEKSEALRPVDPAVGWLVQRWTPSRGRTLAPASVADYLGDRSQAFWAMDREMAEAIQNYRRYELGKKPQLIGFTQNGALVQPTPTHPMYTLNFEPRADGVTFDVTPKFLDTVSSMGQTHDGPDSNNHVRWSHLPAGSPIGHSSGGTIAVHRIAGPMRQVGATQFELAFERGTTDKPAMWFAATSPGDGEYESAVQQMLMNLPRNTAGTPQTLTFNPIADVADPAGTIRLIARSSAGLPVRFFVRAGPAEVDGDTLRLLPIPPRAKFPISVTVVAWQWGRSSEPPVQSAAQVEQTFQIGGTK